MWVPTKVNIAFLLKLIVVKFFLGLHVVYLQPVKCATTHPTIYNKTRPYI